MAEGIKSISGTDLGLAITGIMGPTGATPGKPVGLVYVGLCDDKVCTAKKFVFGDDRILNKQRASQAALEMVRKYLLGIMADIRLFIALKIPDEIKKQLLHLERDLPFFD